MGLGATTMRQAGAHIGSVVHVTLTGRSGATRTASFRLNFLIPFPELEGTVSLGTGAARSRILASKTASLLCPQGPGAAVCQTAEDGEWDPGQRRVVSTGAGGYQSLSRLVLVNRHSRHHSDISPSTSARPSHFPLIFGAMLAVFGAATLTRLLVVSVSRRRREIGLLKVLGFVSRQVASAVVWQATTLALIGVVIGVPWGRSSVGRYGGNLNNLGVVPVSVVPIWLVGALVAGVIVVANMLAIGPALLATRSQAGKPPAGAVIRSR